MAVIAPHLHSRSDVRIKVLGVAVDGEAEHQSLISYVIDDTLAIDAGCLGFSLPLAAQKRLAHVVLSHSHMDHVASLPLLLDNVYQPGPDCLELYGHLATLDCLRRDLFNDRVWPDVFRLSQAETPFLRTHVLKSGVATRIDRWQVLPIELFHVVPTFGFVIDDGQSAVAFVSDTGPTESIWSAINACPRLRCVFLEASFPNAQQSLADRSRHLTPHSLQGELKKLARRVPVLAVHLKIEYRDQIERELEQLERPELQVVTAGAEYVF